LQGDQLLMRAHGRSVEIEFYDCRTRRIRSASAMKPKAHGRSKMTTNGDSILISPVRDKNRQAQLRASHERINRKFGKDLKRLAE